MKPSAAVAVALAAVLAVGDAAAHDTWLAVQVGQGRTALALSTGTRFPLGEVAPPAASIERAACTDGEGVEHPLRAAEAPGTRALQLVVGPNATGPLACRVQLVPFDIELTPQLVDVYLREINAPATVRSAWDDMRRAGKPWRERYVKFARIETSADGAASAAQRAALRAPVADAPLEIVPTGHEPLLAGREAVFRVLARGRPQAGVAVELVSDRSPLGVWLRSDAQGLLRVTLPFAADWLLRATVLDLVEERWDSRFATFAFTARAHYASPAAADSRPVAAVDIAARP